MNFFRQAWVQIRAFLVRLSYAERALLAMLVAVPLLAGAVVLSFAGRSELVPLAHAPDRLLAAESRLQAVGIRYQSRGGQLMVPVSRREEAYLALAQGNLLSADTAAALDKIVADDSPWASPRQREDRLLQAKCRFLSGVIPKMTGVRSADVLADVPRAENFGHTHKRPSAMVNVLMDGERTLNRKMVEAIAGLVSHSFVGMTPQDVVVVDALRGQSYSVKDPEDPASGEAEEQVRALEARYRDKFADLLEHIPGVRIAVSVRADPVLGRQTEKIDYAAAEPLRSTFNRETERTNISDAGEPGPRSNTGISIDGGGGTRQMERLVESREEFADKPIVQKTTWRERGEGARQVNVTVNVPRSYFVGLYRQSNPDAAEDPTDAALETIKSDQLTQIESQVELQIALTEEKGSVRAFMVPDLGGYPYAVPGYPLVSASGGGLVATALGSGWTKPVGLGALAMAAMAMMLYAARRTQQQRLPSIEELAGVPPTLPGEDDLVGQVEAVESAMAGIELGESEIRSRKIAEQIAEMVKGNPAEAAALFSRWIRKET